LKKIKHKTRPIWQSIAKQVGFFLVLVVGKVYFLCFEVRLFGFFSHLQPPLNRIAPTYAEASVDKPTCAEASADKQSAWRMVKKEKSTRVDSFLYVVSADDIY